MPSDSQTSSTPNPPGLEEDVEAAVGLMAQLLAVLEELVVLGKA